MPARAPAGAAGNQPARAPAGAAMNQPARALAGASGGRTARGRRLGGARPAGCPAGPPPRPRARRAQAPQELLDDHAVTQSLGSSTGPSA
jgi:hypothetical protein